MCDCGQIIVAGADDPQSRRLVAHAVSAARSQVAYSRAAGAARRAQVLIGDRAGGESAWAAEQHAQARAASLRQFSQALAEFSAAAEPERVSAADRLIADGAVGELAASARHMAISSLLDSDISHGQAQEAVTALNRRLDDISSLRSVAELTDYLGRHVDELRAGTGDAPALSSGLCLLILILTSVFAVLVLIAAIVCVFSFSRDCQGILDRLIAEACPDSGR